MRPIGITMGDPCGVGPEIICKALAALPDESRSGFIVIGAAQVLARAAKLVAPDLALSTGDARPGAVRVVDVAAPAADTLADGQITAGGGHAAYEAVKRAVQLAEAGDIAAIVTAPLNKAALHRAGHNFDGHTGLLQHLTGAPSSFMLLASERLSTIHVSTHVSLEEAIRRTQTPRVLATIRAGHAHLRRMGLAQPRIAVAGLNPHCGEGGLFGNQDEQAIAPAIAAAVSEGIAASGPWPADTIFYRAMRGAFDLVVAQYHDQGHIPTKLIAFDTTVNVSLGLPVDRTSVDHGTAFDIAWQGKASHENMLAAIAYAQTLGPRAA